jgi:hypothetical protein
MRKVILVALAAFISASCHARDNLKGTPSEAGAPRSVNPMATPAPPNLSDNFNTLLYAYRAYAFVKGCYQIREGYLSVNINEVELERARIKVTSVEEDISPKLLNYKTDDWTQQFFNDDHTIDTKLLFKEAVASINRMGANYDKCHMVLRTLMSLPSKRGGMSIEKDF